jgi:hypothetical protein
MKTLLKPALIALFAIQLAACGGGAPDQTVASTQPRQAATLVRSGATQALSDYYPVVQQLYISYFGRPADPSGLANFAAQLQQFGAPSDIQQLSGAYDSRNDIRALIDGFSGSDESKALYSGDDGVFITAIYQNVLGRAPDADGKAFWVGALGQGILTRPNASLSIMAAALVNTSAQGQLDAILVNKRVSVGLAFTAALDSDVKVKAYAGNAAAATARNLLAGVDANTDTNAYQANVNATIAALVNVSTTPSFATVQGIINARCVSCHSASFAQAGVRLDNATAIHNLAGQIYTQAVVQRSMPFGNATGMTDEERDMVGKWFLAGAQ